MSGQGAGEKSSGNSRPPLAGVRVPGEEYQLQESEVAYRGSFFRVHRERARLPDGAEVTHERIDYPDAVTVIPVFVNEAGERELVLIEQFRNPVRGYIHELPAGMVEPGETPLDCARRELEEETGYRAARWTHVTTLLATPGISRARMTYFLAEDLSRSGEPRPEAGECLRERRFLVDDLVATLVGGEDREGIPAMVDSKAHVGIYYLAAREAASDD